MKKILLLVTLLSVSYGVFAQNRPASKPGLKPATKQAPAANAPAPAPMMAVSGLRSDVDSMSYAIGLNIAQNLKHQGIENVNTAIMMQAMDAVLKNQPTMIDPAQGNTIIQRYFQAMQAKKYEGTRKASEQFLTENKKRAGVTTTPSGLQYEVMKAGDGPKPTASDKVKVHYHGTTIDGKVFDSSVQRNDPAVFNISGLIQGWIEGIPMMPVGSKWKFFVPSNLGYGENGSGPNIPPYSALVFEIELLSIEK